MVEGRTYSSNNIKLLKHLDKLRLIQNNQSPSPVMIHLAPTGVCNLECTYCCYGNRDTGQVLSKESVKSAIKQFSLLGVKGLEWTGGGDPSMWKHLGECVEYATSINEGFPKEWGMTDKSMKQGLITNGLKSPYLDFKTQWKHLDWTRLSFHAFNYLKDGEERLQKTHDNIRTYAPKVDISGVYIWTHGSETRLDQVVAFADRNKIPTRITPDLTLGTENIEKMMPYVRNKLDKLGSEYCFLSDFNVKTERQHDHCYMHMVKPFIFHDGNVYVCPSAALSPDNHLNVNDKFKVCSIDDILKTYNSSMRMRNHDCGFCKYSQQNELIDDLKKETKHNDFA